MLKVFAKCKFPVSGNADAKHNSTCVKLFITINFHEPTPCIHDIREIISHKISQCTVYPMPYGGGNA